jgi:hypothetical protein
VIVMSLLERTSAITLLAAALGIAGPLAQQRPSTADVSQGTAVLGGVVVVADAARAPVRRAVVQLSSGTRGVNQQTVTTEDGRFELAGLPEGRYPLFVSRPGFVDG